MKNKNKTKKGFSIAEAMLSIFILVVGLTATVTLLSSSIKNSINSRDEIIASQLAQEGAEIIINLRDNNILNSQGEYERIPDSSIEFCVDRTDDTQGDPTFRQEASQCGDYKLYSNNTDDIGYYHNSSLTPTKFLRKIRVDDTDELDGKVIKVFVSWNGTDFPSVEEDCIPANKCVQVESVLINRQ